MNFHEFVLRVRAAGIKPEGRRKITANQMYPWTIERETEQWLRKYFKDAGEFYADAALQNTWSFNDDMQTLTNSQYVSAESEEMQARRTAFSIERFQQQTFENFSDMVVGARYIPASVNPSLTKTWEDNFVNLCKSTTDELKKKISAVVSNSVMNGLGIADARKGILETVRTFSYSKATLIARTETAKLNMAINKAQMEEAGIELYEWTCVMDERSRKSHIAMDGRICSWDNPTLVYDKKTKKLKPRPSSAVHLHPGSDYNCRCIALPWDELIDKELNQKKGKPNQAWLEMQKQDSEKREAQRLDRIKLNQLPFVSNFLSKVIDKSSAAEELGVVSSIETKSIADLKTIKSLDFSATDEQKLEAIFTDLKDVASANGWYNTEYGELKFLLDNNLDEGVKAQILGTHTIRFDGETVKKLFSALKKISNNQVLDDEFEADALLTIWHEFNHLKDKVKFVTRQPTVTERIYVESCNEYIANHTIDIFLKQIGGLNYENSSIVHSPNVLDMTSYRPFVSKMNLLVERFNINHFNFANILRMFVDRYSALDRRTAMLEAFKFVGKNKKLIISLDDAVTLITDNTLSDSMFVSYISQ